MPKKQTRETRYAKTIAPTADVRGSLDSEQSTADAHRGRFKVRRHMTPIVGDTVQYKNNSRDAEPLPGIVVSIHNGKVDINIFRLGVMGFRRNVTLAKDA